MYDRQEERELDYARTLAAERFYAREKGEARGEARGELIGTIRTFEQLLRIQNANLAALNAKDLERLAAELKQRWEERNG